MVDQLQPRRRLRHVSPGVPLLRRAQRGGDTLADQRSRGGGLRTPVLWGARVVRTAGGARRGATGVHSRFLILSSLLLGGIRFKRQWCASRREFWALTVWITEA